MAVALYEPWYDFLQNIHLLNMHIIVDYVSLEKGQLTVS
jgi:hypothetical protein